MEANADKDNTGNFEVTVKATGKLLFSKTEGMGFCDSAKKQSTLFAAVEKLRGVAN